MGIGIDGLGKGGLAIPCRQHVIFFAKSVDRGTGLGLSLWNPLRGRGKKKVELLFLSSNLFFG